jgi:hypothetical protein
MVNEEYPRGTRLDLVPTKTMIRLSDNLGEK